MPYQSDSLINSGNSGAEVFIGKIPEITVPNDLVSVRKKLPRTQRSRDSIYLQKQFQSISLGDSHLKSVKILDESIENNDYVISMPYLDGFSGATFAIAGMPHLAQSLAAILNAYFFANLAKSSTVELNFKVVIEKLESVILNCNDEELKNIVSKAKQSVEEFFDHKKTICYPMGPSHGDLTLANIIATSSTDFFLIDFLPSFISSPLLDFCKWRQECVHGWSFRKLPPWQKVTGLIFSKNASPELALQYCTDRYMSACLVLSIINICRIAPYCKNELDKQWLCDSINKEICNLKS